MSPPLCKIKSNRSKCRASGTTNRCTGKHRRIHYSILLFFMPEKFQKGEEDILHTRFPRCPQKNKNFHTITSLKVLISAENRGNRIRTCDLTAPSRAL